MSAPTGEKPPWRAASANVDGVEGADRKSATGIPSPAPAILLIPYVIRDYNTTKTNKVGLSVIQITNLSKYSK